MTWSIFYIYYTNNYCATTIMYLFSIIIIVACTILISFLLSSFSSLSHSKSTLPFSDSYSKTKSRINSGFSCGALNYITLEELSLASSHSYSVGMRSIGTDLWTANQIFVIKLALLTSINPIEERPAYRKVYNYSLRTVRR